MDRKMIVDRKQIRTSYSDVRTRAVEYRGKTPPVPTDSGDSGPEVEVHVSPEAQLFARLKEHLRRLPEIREDRIEAVRQKLLNGVYRIDPEPLADRLLDSE
ncbi:MAG: hypothetical protein KatS3mg115_2283 [Candidatus Poribacteria bacterium]|nr:MAG: hypothetical protein KatS3mg115_2283 [Candidatus Poribacteria bacterium]